MIPERTQELNDLFQEIFGEPEPQPKTNGNGHKPTQPTNMSDRELLEVIFASKNGEKYRRLREGDWSGYPSQSEADQAWANILAHFTGDENQTDRMFRDSGLYREKWDAKRGAKTYGERTIDRAFAGRTDFWRGETSEPTFTFTATASESDDPDIAAMRAEIERLRTQLADTEAERQRLKSKLTNLAQMIKNPHLKTISHTIFALVNEYESTASRGEAVEGWVKTSRPRIAENSGNSEQSISDHLKMIDEEMGLFERRSTRTLRERVDPETGEISESYVSVLEIRPRAKPDEIIMLARDYEPHKDKPTWGGRRVSCPDHPDAGVIIRRTIECAECREILEEKETYKPTENQECQDDISEDTPPPVVNVSIESHLDISDERAAERQARDVKMTLQPQKIIPIRERRRCSRCNEPCGSADMCSPCASRAAAEEAERKRLRRMGARR